MKVTVVVLNWNNTTDVLETIESLICQDYDNLEIVIVDNDSKEGVSSFVKQKYPSLSYIDNKENIGWAGGNNVGIKYAISNDTDLVILANNDILIDDKKLITKIVNTYIKYPSYFNILGVKLMDYKVRTKIQECGTTIFNSKSHRYLLNDYIQKDPFISDSIRYYDGVPGAFMIISKETFAKNGYFDENFFMYGEETEYCLRGWINGIKSAVNEELVVYHKGAVSSGTGSPFMVYYKTRNLIYLLGKHKKNIKYYNYFIYKLVMSHLKQVMKFIFKGKKGLRLIYALFSGILHSTIYINLGKNNKI